MKEGSFLFLALLCFLSASSACLVCLPGCLVCLSVCLSASSVLSRQIGR